MRITERRLQGAIVLELREMLTHDARALLVAVRRVARTGRTRIVLDLERVPSIDAAGIGALVAAYGLVRRQGGTFRLANVASRVHTLLVICRLVPELEIFDAVEAAALDGPSAASESARAPTPQNTQSSLDLIQPFLQRS